MAVNIPDTLPAKAILESENIFAAAPNSTVNTSMCPLHLLILNLMPVKSITEIHLLRVLSNTPLMIDVELLMITSHVHKNTPAEHLNAFYKTFDKVKHRNYDGMIITGAPLELIEFNEVTYWNELCSIMEWSRRHVTSTFHICWGAQAGLYHHFGINKHVLPRKMSGIFKHSVHYPNEPLVRGFDDVFNAPHSRYTGVSLADIVNCEELMLVSDSEEAGAYIVMSRDRRLIFVTGHPEYGDNTLNSEYWRDVNKGLDIHVPCNYYPNNNPNERPLVTWRSCANLLYSNWLNYYVFQSI